MRQGRQGRRLRRPAAEEPGKTDRGISQELVATRKTVEAHVRSILGKLALPTDANENRRVHAVLACLRAGGAARGSNPVVKERRHG